MTFQVGKKYKSNVTGWIYECVFVGEKISILKHGQGDKVVFHNDYFDVVEEHQEPKVAKCEIHINLDDEGLWHTSGRATGTVGRVEITHTEGKGLSVEILEG